MSRRTPRTYTYAIPMDDTRAMSKVRVLEKTHPDYHIYKPRRKEIAVDRVKYLGIVFYSSRETYDYDRDTMVGGTLPGLSEYRFSLEWEKAPFGPGRLGALEMKAGPKGGTHIRGEIYTGHYLGKYTPIDTVVDFTPTEVRNNPHDPELQAELQHAEQEGMDAVEEAHREYQDDCPHISALEGCCEDCGLELTEA